MLLSACSIANTITVVNKNNSGAGSLRDAIANSASSDTIRFSPSLIATGSDTIKLSTEIVTLNNLVIKGLYNSLDTLYISGKNTNRIFTLQGTNLVLDSLVLINGRSNNGGALYITAFGATATISNSLFKSNISTVKGGAIHFYNGTLNITNSTFKNNSATSDGGAIYCQLGGDLTVYKSSFTYNTSGNSGGAIFYGDGTTAVCSILTTNISNNTSTWDGAALYCKGRYFYMDSTKVEYNIASGGLRKGIIYFGGISKFDIYLDNSEINNNTGLGVSSLISLGYSVNTESKMYCNRCTFSSNSNGGIYSEVFADNANSSSILEVNYSTISNNGDVSSTCGGVYSTAWGFGTGYSFNSNVKVKNSTIVNNSNSGNGSGVFSQGKLAATSYLEVKSSIVANNSGVNLYSFSTASSITSLGNNIFSNSSVIGSAASDQLGVTNASLNLGSLGYNGGFTRTIRPNTGSVAINLGNATDFTNAQNGPISGRRDIGSTEWIQCIKTHTYSSTICQGDSVLFNSTYPKIAGAYTQTIVVGSCDSIVTLNLNVNPKPTISVNSGSICSGNSFTINPAGANTYTISGGSSVVTPTSNASYSITGTSAQGCASSNTAVSTVTVNALPIVIAITNNTLLCTGQSASLTANGASSYLWNTSQTTPVIVVSPTITTTYSVTGTDVAGCSNTAILTQSVSNCTGIQVAEALEATVNIYPNPSNGIYNISGLTENTRITIYDAIGQIIYSSIAIDSKETINISEIPSGIYVIHISSKSMSLTKKLIKKD